MDIRKLDAFCKVYEMQNFSKAGEVMFLSQPTISSHVANLEEQLGVRLFDRLGRKVIPTQAGHVLYRGAVAIFENLDQAKASIELLRDKVVGELVIGCSTIPSLTIVPDVLSGFSVKYPDVSFSINTLDSGEVIKRVSDGEFPVGIVGQDPDDDQIESYLMSEDEVVVVASPDAPWSDSGTISLDALTAMPWVMREKGSGTRNVLENALIKAGMTLKDLNIRCQVNGTCETIAHTINGVGVSITSLAASKHLIDSGRLIRLQVPELEGQRQFYLIYHHGRHMFPALKTFIEYIKN